MDKRERKYIKNVPMEFTVFKYKKKKKFKRLLIVKLSKVEKWNIHN